MSAPHSSRSRRSSLRLGEATSTATTPTSFAPPARRGSLRGSSNNNNSENNSNGGGGGDAALPIPSALLPSARRSLAGARRRYSHALSATSAAAAAATTAGGTSSSSTTAAAAAAANVFTVHVDGDDGGVELRMACKQLYAAVCMRNRYSAAAGRVMLPCGSSNNNNSNNNNNNGSNGGGGNSDGDGVEGVDNSTTTTTVTSGSDAQRAPSMLLSQQPVTLHVVDGVYVVHEPASHAAATATVTAPGGEYASASSRVPTAAGRTSSSSNAVGGSGGASAAAAAALREGSDVTAAVVPWEQFYDDVCALAACVQQPMCRAACACRLQLLEEKHHLYQLCNGEHGEEQQQQQQRVRRRGSSSSGGGGGGSSSNGSSSSSGSDGGVDCLVDNYVEMQTMMEASWLSSFMRRTLRTRGGDVVAMYDGGGGGGDVVMGGGHGGAATRSSSTTSQAQQQQLTLQRLCELCDMDGAHGLSVDALGLHPRVERPLSRFDVLDASTSQGVPHCTRLLRLFLTRDGPGGGSYLADAVRHTLQVNSGSSGSGDGGDVSDGVDDDHDGSNNNNSGGGGGDDGSVVGDECNCFVVHDDEVNDVDGGVDGDSDGSEHVVSDAEATDDGVHSLSGGGGGGSSHATHRHRHSSRPRHRPRGGVAAAAAAVASSSAMPRRVHEVGIDVTGLTADEWEHTAAWLHEHRLDTQPSVQWMATLSWRRIRAAAATTTAAAGTSSSSSTTAMAAATMMTPSSSAMTPVSRSSSPMTVHTPTTTAAATSLAAAAAASTSSASAVSGGGGGGAAATLDNYQQFFDHLFRPLFVATLSPDDARCSTLARLLHRLGAFVFVADEDEPECVCVRARRRPADVPWAERVSCHYVMYYLYTNLCALNTLRRRRGLNTLQLRVLSGTRRAPSTRGNDVLVSAYLLCDAVVNALALEVQPVLQYLYGLHRVGVLACPLCNHGLATVSYAQHPLPSLLRRGLCVSLCTVTPLLFHHSSDALREEYATAQRLYYLSRVDVRELAYNGVMLSTCTAARKARALGCADVARVAAVAAGAAASPSSASAAAAATVAALIEQQCALPLARVQLRRDMWAAELAVLQHSVHSSNSNNNNNTTTSQQTQLQHNAPSQERRQSSGSNNSGGDEAASRAQQQQQQQQPKTPATLGLSRELPSRAPYVVHDARANYPRVLLVGPYDRDMQYAAVAQSLRRALELRSQYVQPYHRMRQVDMDALAAAAAARGDDGGVGIGGSDGHDATHTSSGVPRRAYEQQQQQQYGGGSSSYNNSDAAAAAAPFDEDEWMYKTVEGVIVPHEVHQIPRLPQGMHHYDDYRAHVQEIRELLERQSVRSFAGRRMQLLEHRFLLHVAVNHGLEAGTTASRASQNRDLYQATKVDNNVRMETGMTARQLLEFIVRKAHSNGDDIVAQPPGREPQTLRQLLQELHIRADALTVDDLNVYVDSSRDDVDDGSGGSGGGAMTTTATADDDNANNNSSSTHPPPNAATSPYTPVARNALLTLLLTTNNAMSGRYFAELTQMTFANYRRDRFTFTESRLPIYGARGDEWELLSMWFDTHGMASPHNQWLVQFPRMYGVLRRRGAVASFAAYLENLFAPLWAVSLHPNAQPRLFHFVNQISGFDCVGDERRDDAPLHTTTCAPHEWVSDAEPPYNYYLYHLWANIYSLNAFRRRRGFSTFVLRPSCGEAGAVDHLIGGFLLAHDISYGLQLRNEGVLQYLYYLAQIGVTLSPLSNNAKLLSYLDSPFPAFFRRGLVVTLGTESPLLHHQTQEPLLEEYSIASKIWRLQPNDLCEIARNSVVVSSFARSFQQERLGALFFLSSSAANDASRTHLSDVRVAYRFETYHSEVGFLEYVAGQTFPKAMYTLAEEQQRLREWRERVQWHMAALAARRRRLHPLRQQQATTIAGGKKGSNSNKDDTTPAVTAAADEDDEDEHLIDATANEVDLSKVSAQRNVMLRQLDTLTRTLQELQRQNKQLTDKLSEERERDMQAAQLRRTRAEHASSKGGNSGSQRTHVVDDDAAAAFAVLSDRTSAPRRGGGDDDDVIDDADDVAVHTRDTKLTSLLSLALPPARTATASLLTRLTSTYKEDDGNKAGAAADGRGAGEAAAAVNDMDSGRVSVSLHAAGSLLLPSQQAPSSSGRRTQRNASDIRWQLPVIAAATTTTSTTGVTGSGMRGSVDDSNNRLQQQRQQQQQQQAAHDDVAMDDTDDVMLTFAQQHTTTRGGRNSNSSSNNSGGGDTAGLLGFAETLWSRKPLS